MQILSLFQSVFLRIAVSEESKFFVASFKELPTCGRVKVFLITGTISMSFVSKFGTYSPKVCQTLTVLFNRDPDASREADKGINRVCAV